MNRIKSFAVTLPMLLLLLLACGDTNEITMQEKEQYQWKIESSLSALSDEILSMKNKAEDAADSLAPQIEERMTELDHKKTELEKSLRELEDATEEEWQELKKEIEDQLTSVQEFLSTESQASLKSTHN